MCSKNADIFVFPCRVSFPAVRVFFFSCFLSQRWGIILTPTISYTSDKHNGKLANGVTNFLTSFLLLFEMTNIEQQPPASKCTKSK